MARLGRLFLMTISYSCPFCGSSIALADVNVAMDLALCRQCGQTTAFSGIAPLGGAEAIDLQHPPKGVRLEEHPIHGTTIFYRRIPGVVFFLIPFALVWSGFSLGGIYGRQLWRGQFEMGPSLFGLPFLVGTVFLLLAIGWMLFGKVRVGFPAGEVTVTLELGPLAWTRRLAVDRGARVCLATSEVNRNGQRQQAIQIDCQGKTLKFGTMMELEAKIFMAEALRRALHKC